MTGWDFLVRKANVREHATHDAEADITHAPLADGELVLRIEAIALTANTLTYAVAGDLLGYWKFYPAPDGWGRVPAWGYAEVVQSAHPDVRAGERLFGYVPMSSHTRMLAGEARDGSLTDITPHRRPLPAAYNFYQRVGITAQPLTDDDLLRAVVNPLFFTAFLLDDLIAERGWDAAGTLLLSSASSKTAFGTAFLLHARRPAARIIGLTSAHNRPFVDHLGLYDAIIDYDELDELTTLGIAGPVTFLDFAGNASLANQLIDALGDQLTRSLRIGATHWTALAGARGTAEPFFAPSRIVERTKQWGPAGLQDRYAAAWSRFLPYVRPHLQLDIATGPAALADRYDAIAAGSLAADRGYIIRP